MDQLNRITRNPEHSLKFDTSETLLKSALVRIGQQHRYESLQCNTPIVRFLVRAHSRFGLTMPSHISGFESAFDAALSCAIDFYFRDAFSNTETRRGGFIYTFIRELAQATIFWQMSYEHQDQRMTLDLAKRNPFAEIAGSVSFHHQPTPVLQTHFYYSAYLQLLNLIASNLDIQAVKNYLVFDHH